MADCKWEQGCTLGPKKKPAPAVPKSIYCNTHRLKKQADEELERQKKVEAKKLEARKLEMVEMAKHAQDVEDKKKKKEEKIKTIAAGWKVEVNTIVQKVKGLRSQHGNLGTINAGSNPGIGDTKGGSDSPLELKLPSDAKGLDIQKSDVFALMQGFDGSDSSHLKIRTVAKPTNILVHIK